MTNHNKRPDGAGDSTVGLSAAAAGLEAEIQRFEKLTGTATRTVLDSQKAIDHTAQAINSAAESHAKFGEYLQQLITAVGVARDRQQASAATLNARSAEIAERRTRFEAIRARFTELGSEAAGINALVREASGLQRAGADAVGAGDVILQIEKAVASMESVATRAGEIMADARAENITDLEREADALRQQILAARNKLQHVSDGLRERQASSN